MRPYHERGCTRYGADMGRRSSEMDDTILTAVPVPIVDGYDPGGAYWGSGTPLWCVTDEGSGVSYDRAPSYKALAEIYTGHVVDFPRTIEPEDIQDMIAGYIDCMLTTTADHDRDEDESGDTTLHENYTADDLDVHALSTVTLDCETFAKLADREILASIGRCGPYGRKPVDFYHVGFMLFASASGLGIGFEDGDFPAAVDAALSSYASDIGGHDFMVNGDAIVI